MFGPLKKTNIKKTVCKDEDVDRKYDGICDKQRTVGKCHPARLDCGVCGKFMLSNLDVLHSRLNPDNLQGEALNEADLDVPDDSPQNLLSVAKLIPLLQDMQSADGLN